MRTFAAVLAMMFLLGFAASPGSAALTSSTSWDPVLLRTDRGTQRLGTDDCYYLDVDRDDAISVGDFRMYACLDSPAGTRVQGDDMQEIGAELAFVRSPLWLYADIDGDGRFGKGDYLYAESIGPYLTSGFGQGEGGYTLRATPTQHRLAGTYAFHNDADVSTYGALVQPVGNLSMALLDENRDGVPGPADPIVLLALPPGQPEGVEAPPATVYLFGSGHTFGDITPFPPGSSNGTGTSSPTGASTTAAPTQPADSATSPGPAASTDPASTSDAPTARPEPATPATSGARGPTAGSSSGLQPSSRGGNAAAPAAFALLAALGACAALRRRLDA